MTKQFARISALEFCLHLNNMFFRGKKFEEINFDAIDERIEFQRLDAKELKQVKDFVLQKRTEAHDRMIQEQKEALKKSVRRFFKLPNRSMMVA